MSKSSPESPVDPHRQRSFTLPLSGTLLPLCLVIGLLSCTPVRRIRPIDKGDVAVSAGLGGPFTSIFNTYIPLPLLSVGANVGLGHGLDVEGGANVTDAIFGVMVLDLGLNYRPWQPEGWRPELIAGVHGFLASNFAPGATRAYPVVSLTFAWKTVDWLYPYAGIDNWFELRSRRADGLAEDRHWLPCLHAGVDLGRKKWHVQIEGKLYTPNEKNTNRPVVNAGAGDYGVWGVYLGVSRDFRR